MSNKPTECNCDKCKTRKAELDAVVDRTIRKIGFVLVNVGPCSPEDEHGEHDKGFSYTAGNHENGFPEIIATMELSTEYLGELFQGIKEFLSTHSSEYYCLYTPEFLKHRNCNNAPVRIKLIKLFPDEAKNALNSYMYVTRARYPVADHEKIAIYQAVFPDENNVLPGEDGYLDIDSQRLLFDDQRLQPKH